MNYVVGTSQGNSNECQQHILLERGNKSTWAMIEDIRNACVPL